MRTYTQTVMDQAVSMAAAQLGGWHTFYPEISTMQTLSQVYGVPASKIYADMLAVQDEAFEIAEHGA